MWQVSRPVLSLPNTAKSKKILGRIKKKINK